MLSAVAEQRVTPCARDCAQLVDHYPYAACTPKEVLTNPIALRAEINACEKVKA